MTIPNNLTKEEIFALRAFFSHLLTYSLVNTGLILINLTTSTEHWWFIHSVYGWGIGLIIHAFQTPKLRQAIFGT